MASNVVESSIVPVRQNAVKVYLNTVLYTNYKFWNHDNTLRVLCCPVSSCFAKEARGAAKHKSYIIRLLLDVREVWFFGHKFDSVIKSS